MDIDFDSARQRINERLNQELTRIQNLPKKSKIKICNKHGLKHAHHMNNGLLKSLEVDLAIIKREERRVTNELQKKTRTFTENTQRSFPRLLPIPGQEHDDNGLQEKKREFPNQRSPQRFHASWTKPELPDYFSRIENLENQHRKAFLMAITEQSKQTTKKIIEENIKKMETSTLKTEPNNDSLVTRLNKRLELRKSCFPSLLGTENSSLLGNIPENINTKRTHPKPDSYYKGTTYFMPEIKNGTTLDKKEVGEKTKSYLEKDKFDSQSLSQNAMKLKILPKIEVSEAGRSKHDSKRLKKIIKRKVVGHDGQQGVPGRLGLNGLRLNQTVLKVTKKMNSQIKLDGTTKMRKENSVFSKHWS